MRRAHVLPLFGLCAAALLGVMAWLTVTLRRLDEAERRGREQAALEESVRLALWRMESLVAPLVAQENARWPGAYRALGAPDEASPLVRLHFQWDARGRLSAAPPDPAATPERATAEELRARAARLADREALLARLPEGWIQTESATLEASQPKLAAKVPAPPRKEQATPSEQQQALSEVEYQARASNVMVLRGEVSKVASPPGRATPIRLGRLEPLWLGHELVLARRVQVGEDLLVQACWLDWPELRGTLLAAVQDLLPEASLEPAGEDADPARRLAALPVKLLAGRPAAAPAASSGREGLPLAAAWGLAALALAAIGTLLSGLAALGERRAAFVSAVTHELRTPLTTFRMYADMLAEGMVPPERQPEYLETLRREAERQAHLVENVLAYSRLERGRYRAVRETLSAADLVAGLRDGLAAQAARAGMDLVGPDPESLASLRVVADRSAVERILSNLVDNACKYARQAGDRRIHLEGRADSRAVWLSVGDHGPGVARADLRRLFRPFHKSASEAAQSAPGVGLGLALSRRLARAQGGDLRVEPWEGGGARFALRLPRA